MIDAAGVHSKVNYAYEVCDDNQETHYYPDESTSFLFIEPSEEELMSTINTYCVEETPVEEVAEGMFSGEFVAGEDDFVAFLERLAPLKSCRNGTIDSRVISVYLFQALTSPH